MSQRTITKCDICGKTFKYRLDSETLKHAGFHEVQIKDEMVLRISMTGNSDMCLECISHYFKEYDNESTE